MGPLLPGFRYAPYNDLGAVKQLLTIRPAAIMLEPVQGEGVGVNIPDESFLKARRSADERGNLLI